jgi:hypothetical protein
MTMLTYANAADLMRTARNGRRKLGNNTYLESAGSDYAVRLHGTSVVIIHADGTYTLNTGGWGTVTTKARINEYGPARVCSDRGTWYVWHSSDPRTAPKIQTCRTCRGTGEVTIDDYGYRYVCRTESYSLPFTEKNGQTYAGREWQIDFGRISPLQRDGRPVTGQPDFIRIVGQPRRERAYVRTGTHQETCYNCHGERTADYGSKSRPAEFYDGIRVDSDGMVISECTRQFPTREEIAAREAAAEQARRTREREQRAATRAARGELNAWLTERGLMTEGERRPARVILVKAVGHDLVSQNGMLYAIGSTVTADDYTADAECGHGLHFCATPANTENWVQRHYRVRFLACSVETRTMLPVQSKVKARTCKVLYEVDAEGNQIS